MIPYEKIKTIWGRDPRTKYKTLIDYQWAIPEFEYLSNATWLWYEKMDGTNIRAIYWPSRNSVEFRGRTDRAQIPPFLLDALCDKITSDSFDAFDLDKSGDLPITLYGEGIGKRIQRNGGRYGEPDFCLFDIKIGDFWMEQHFVTEIASGMRILRAPVINQGNLHKAIYQIKKHQQESRWGSFLIEGFIVRPLIDLYTRRGNRIIGKIKHKDFPEKTSGV